MIMSSAFRSVVSRAIGFLNRARLGFPELYFSGTGGIGDDLMCTTVFHELRRRGAQGIAMTTQYPDLFHNNPDLDKIVSPCGRRSIDRWLCEGLPFLRLGYAHYDPIQDRDEPVTEHVLAKLCRLAGVHGPVNLRPYLYLKPEEMTAGRLAEHQIVIQSSGRGAAHFMENKEWYPGRFQEVCRQLSSHYTIIQIGSKQAPALEGATDMRGKTTLRQSAAILANSSLFIGLVGFVMHLARAVDCPSVIVYGGRERPWQTGYTANINITGNPDCSPCWLRNRCAYHHECMDAISTDTVLSGIQQQLDRPGKSLAIETATL